MLHPAERRAARNTVGIPATRETDPMNMNEVMIAFSLGTETA